MKTCALMLGSLLVFSLSPVGAQEQEKKPEKSVFQQVFPKPTGKNGYEELVYAGELARDSQLFRKVEQSEATLAQKREVLNDPTIQKALTFLRAGLAKQTFSPRVELDDETLLPEFALFRQLARLLAIEQYVYLADGNIGGAIDSMRDGLLLGYRCQTDTLISGLVGVAIDAIMVGRMVNHLDQFSVRDCNRLIRLMEEWIDAPSPMLAVIESERRGMATILKKYRDDPKGLHTAIRGIPDPVSPPSDPTPLDTFLESENPNLGPVMDMAAAMMNSRFDQLMAELRRPAWERKSLPPLSEKTLAGELVGSLFFASNLVTDRYETERANMRLLAVHTAIRRYRWEYDRPPDTLKDLRLDKKFTTDPFTGETLTYQRSGDTYELFSAGPFARNKENQSSLDTREPVYLPRKPAPPAPPAP